MNKKKLFIGIIAVCLIATGSLTFLHVDATDFSGQESKYIKLCSSSKLSQKQQTTCKEFNTYLNNKNKKLSQASQETKKDVAQTKDSIEDISQQISDIDTKISTTKQELSYIEKSIDNLNKKVEDKKSSLEDRLYNMQTTLNSHTYSSYLFGAEDFSDFMSRVASFKEITSYDNELIEELLESIKEIEKQQATLKILKDSLDQDKQEQTSLQKKLTAKLTEQNKELAANNSEISKNQESMESIQSNLAAIKKASEESRVNNVTSATANKKPSKPSTNTSQNNSQSSSDNTQSNTPSTDQATGDSDTPSSNEELGLKIANKALTRQGYMYVWGGAHSWSSIKNPNWTQFDCSGLVNWAFYQSGVDLGRIHYTGSLVNAGKSVSKSDLQAGDIILFSSNGSSSGVHHVGIYIGDNKMVHAPTTGQPVQVSKLSSSYWQKEWYSCRRLY